MDGILTRENAEILACFINNSQRCISCCLLLVLCEIDAVLVPLIL